MAVSFGGSSKSYLENISTFNCGADVQIASIRYWLNFGLSVFNSTSVKARSCAAFRQKFRFGSHEEIRLALSNCYSLFLSSDLISSSAVFSFVVSAEIDSVMSD